MHTYTGGTDTSEAQQDPAESEQIVTLTPLYIVFGLIFAISWAMIWKQRILNRPRDSQTSTGESACSTEH
jgi:hypothetical protein